MPSSSSSKTVDVKKSHVGLTFIRDSNVPACSHFTERAPNLGGLIEFYRSPDRVDWSPTGVNVPDYPAGPALVAEDRRRATRRRSRAQEAMDRLAGEMDQMMARMQQADEANKTYEGCGPRLNAEKIPSEWLASENGPQAKLDNESPAGRAPSPMTN